MPTATERFILEHRLDRVDALALALAGRQDVDAAFALRQIEGWQRLRAKVPAWAAVENLHYPPRLALEQCSGEAAAAYKLQVARRLLPGGGTLVDLTGGLGVDFSFLARHFGKAVYVERQAELCRLARHNFPLLGLPAAEVVEADGAGFLAEMPKADLVFLDPARRDGAGRKTVLMEDCEPDVQRLLPRLLGKAAFVMLKLSPMLDLHCAVKALGCVVEAHVFAVRGECKDLLLVLARDASSPVICCAEDGATFAFTAEEEGAARPAYAVVVKEYLYEPGPSLLKAGAFKTVAVRYGLEKLHPNTHLYTSGSLVPEFPGRTFRVERTSGFGKRELRAFCGGVERANLTVRNFPGTVAELRRRMRVKEGGEEYWFAATLADGNRILIACRKP